MITTSSTVTITKTLRLGQVTSYATNALSLFIKCNGTQKRFDATTIVNSTETTQGLITFANVPLWEDGSYSMYITAEASTDLDINGAKLTKLATGYIKKITNVSTLSL